MGTEAPIFRRRPCYESCNTRRGEELTAEPAAELLCSCHHRSPRNSPPMVLHTNCLELYWLPCAFLTIHALLAVLCPPGHSALSLSLGGHSFAFRPLEALVAPGPLPPSRCYSASLVQSWPFGVSPTVRCPLDFLESYWSLNDLTVNSRRSSWRTRIAILLTQGSPGRLASYILAAGCPCGSSPPFWSLVVNCHNKALTA